MKSGGYGLSFALGVWCVYLPAALALGFFGAIFGPFALLFKAIDWMQGK